MKVGVIGSRTIIKIDLDKYLPKETTEIISGGAKGVDTLAKNFALNNNIKITEYLPKYELYGKTAPLKRNIEIINNSDIIIVFWDGTSRGTKFVIDECEKINKRCILVMQ